MRARPTSTFIELLHGPKAGWLNSPNQRSATQERNQVERRAIAGASLRAAGRSASVTPAALIRLSLTLSRKEDNDVGSQERLAGWR
jgi:hypothetical protein